MTNSETPWLSTEEQAVWRSWLEVTAHLPVALGRDLHERSALSLSDFDVLVQLSEHPEGRMRFAALASALQWERSRLSHHVGRMQRRGLVDREDCLDDARGAFAVITAAGREAIERAAPDHVALVRRLVFDALPDDDRDRLGGVLAAISERLRAHADRAGVI